MKLTLIAGLLTLPGSLALGQETVSLSVTPSVTRVSANEPILIRLVIANRGSEPFKANIDGSFHDDFVVSMISNGSKRVIPWSPHQEADLGWFINSINLAPGEIHTKPLILNEWVRQLPPGSYRFEIGLRGSITESTPFQVEVLPRNPQRLRRVCSDLADQIVSNGSPEHGVRLAHALSYTIDPEAVPFLQKVLVRSDDYAWVSAKGLMAIGDSTAVSALGALVRTASTDFARSTVMGSLGTLRLSTRDHAIKSQIDALLHGR